MAEIFKNKVIYILSPQSWGRMRISKHHYAIELAKKGNEVYFINSPQAKVEGKIKVEAIQEADNLYQLSYQTLFPFRIGQYSRALFNWLIQFQIQAIIKAIGKKPDVVWSFEPNIFSHLDKFGAAIRIYHPVDPVPKPHQRVTADSAQVVFSVSQKILSSFQDRAVPQVFINHGLAEHFVQIARKNLEQVKDYLPAPRIQIGYVGNLLHPAINRAILLQMMEEHSKAEFHLWGPTALKESNVAGFGDVATREFIENLKAMPNVQLHGAVPPTVLSKAIQNMDAFVLSYGYMTGSSDRSNSHKILEYLSTGKVVISSKIETYTGYPDMIRMPDEDVDDDLPALLTDTLNHLSHWNQPALMEKRIRFGLDNSYKRQIERIEEVLEKILHKSPESQIA